MKAHRKRQGLGRLLASKFATAIALCLIAGASLADEAPASKAAPTTAPQTTAPPTTSSAPVDKLMAKGPLPDVVQGSPSAPITIIEYASMTCTHCAAFQNTTWGELKSKYIDKGRVKFILREFPLDPLAAAAFMLARCAGPERRGLLVDELFAHQKTWVVEKPVQPLLAVVEGAGLTKAEFEKCMHNQALFKQVMQSREHAAKAFGVDSTPTFFINGQRLVGDATIADFEKRIDAVKP